MVYDRKIIYECSLKNADLKFNILIDRNFMGNTIPSTMHNHPIFEVHYICTGEYLLQTDNDKIQLKEGSCCIIKPNVYHTVHACSDHTKKHCFRFVCESDDQKLLELLDLSNWKNHIFIYEDIVKETEIIQNILSEFNTRSFGYLTYIDNLLSLLLINMLRKVSSKSFNDESSRIQTLKRYTVIDDFMYAHFRNDVSLDDLAKYIGISKRQVNRIMVQLYDLTFTQKITQMRIIEAKNLIVSDENITNEEIAETIGYNNPYYFVTVFRKVTGMTPDSFRRSI